MDELISLIVPVYNGGGYLIECLKSLAVQTYRNLEIICVDDGSTDGSGALLDSYGVRDPRFRVIHVANGGVSRARNIGMEEIHGEWFGFIDADDVAGPTFCEILLANARASSSSVSACRFVRGGLPRGLGSAESGSPLVLEGAGRCVENFICGGPMSLEGMAWNKLYKSSVYSGVRWREGLAVMEDCLWSYEVLSHCERACLDERELYFWRTREGSASRSHKEMLELAPANVFLELLERCAWVNSDELAMTLKVNYVRSATKALIDAGPACLGSVDGEDALARLRAWGREAWPSQPAKERLKWLYAVVVMPLLALGHR